jgi:hypothetical protein
VKYVLVCLLLAGCAGTTGQVVPASHGTYLIANRGVMGWSSAGAQKAKAYQQANDFCAKQGKEVEALNEHGNEGGYGRIASADIEFKCVSP